MTRKLRGLARRRHDDRPLLVRARDRPELFGQFFADRREAVLGFFARRVLDPETAFDLMAETFASAYADLQNFRGQTELECHSWLWTIARHHLYRWRERGEVERRSVRRLGIELPPMSAAEYDRTEELADLERVRERITRSLGRLPDDQREAVNARVVDELPYEQIAAEAGVSEMVIRARVSRGLRRLSVLLRDTVDEEAGR